ncbi:hypothetical protein IWC96_04210 [Brevundimonas sp. BAL450]|nr:hypothetical protein [Brevundimonas sp. BAL450]MBG7614486.1 hypothetical protein [Brevundimonas sp. BAL450]
MHLSNDMVEETGMIGDGETILMRPPFVDLDRIEYRSGGVDCRLDREAIQDVLGAHGSRRRTVVLRPCGSTAGPE